MIVNCELVNFHIYIYIYIYIYILEFVCYFKVIDEADRQMEDIYDDWLSQIEAAAYKPKKGAHGSYHRVPPGPCTIAR